jgi:hypothetical protein
MDAMDVVAVISFSIAITCLWFWWVSRNRRSKKYESSGSGRSTGSKWNVAEVFEDLDFDTDSGGGDCGD